MHDFINSTQLKTLKERMGLRFRAVNKSSENADTTRILRTAIKTAKPKCSDENRFPRKNKPLQYGNSEIAVSTTTDNDQTGKGAPRKRRSKNDNSSQQLSFNFTCQYTAVKPKGFT